MKHDYENNTIVIESDEEAFNEGLDVGLLDWVAYYPEVDKVTIVFADERKMTYVFSDLSYMDTFMEYMNK